MFEKLLKKLMKQVDKHQGAIRVIAYWNNGELPIGEIRQTLLEAATGTYVCFIDDDDAIPAYYCDEIIKALGKDYVGFRVRLLIHGVVHPPVYHSLKYDSWFEDRKGYYRNVTHLNPIKRKLALVHGFQSNEFGEDGIWARDTLPLVKTENYINKIMYYYHYGENSSWKVRPAYRTFARPKVKYKFFKYIGAPK